MKLNTQKVMELFELYATFDLSKSLGKDNDGNNYSTKYNNIFPEKSFLSLPTLVFFLEAFLKPSNYDMQLSLTAISCIIEKLFCSLFSKSISIDSLQNLLVNCLNVF